MTSDACPHRMRWTGAALLAPLVATAVPATTRAAPDSDLWAKWEAHDPSSQKTIDHTAWAQFLGRHVRRQEDGINRVTYAIISQDDRRRLARYIESLSNIAIGTHNRREQFAYWVNLYNALTVRVVLDHFPVKSIRDIQISPGWFSQGPWGKKLVTVEGEALSLDDIEHRVLRPIWKDPRIHYAVNCAALGCPNLRMEPFDAGRIEGMLEAAARDFINHPRGARVVEGKLYVSSIYRWYQADFGGSEAGVIAHLRRYATGPLADSLKRVSRIHSDDYDWSLNDGVGEPD